jgi:hypothetical protein
MQKDAFLCKRVHFWTPEINLNGDFDFHSYPHRRDFSSHAICNNRFFSHAIRNSQSCNS